MSSVEYFRGLLAQEPRIEAFRRAIHAVVRPGDVVLEIGTGLGTFAFFAADAGASVVWAVDGDPIVHVAETVGRLNGYHDRVRFVRGWIPDVTIPDRADVIIFEDFPPRFLDGRLVRLLDAARAEFAKPGVRFVPSRATFHMAPVGGDGVATVVAALGESEVRYGIDWSPSREYVANAVAASTIPADAMLAAPAALGTVDLAAGVGGGRGVAALGGEACWQMEQDCEIGGLAYWCDLELGGGERLSNAPGAYPGSWSQCLLPVDPPIRVAQGTPVRGTVRREPRGEGGGKPGWMTWEIEAGGEVRRGHEFRAAPASAADLAMASPDGVPTLSRRGRVAAKILGLTDGHRRVREIAASLAASDVAMSQKEAERLVVGTLAGQITREQRR